jgi:menaquinone-specific isochorismate synthase
VSDRRGFAEQRRGGPSLPSEAVTTTSIRRVGTRVRTVPVDAAGDLLRQLPDAQPFAWVRGGEGLVGWGEALRFDAGCGADRFHRAKEWWRDTCAALDVVDDVGLPGSGPVAFGSFTFDPATAGSVLVVPCVVLGRHRGRAWMTTVGDPQAARSPVAPPAPPRGVRYADGALSPPAWHQAVRAAVAAIRAGDLEKVVLALDLIAASETPPDPRFLLQRLGARFPGCWTFSCAGLVGATPELLLRRQGSLVESGVLAGSVARGRDASEDARLGGWLMASEKDRAEHAISVRSVSAALEPYCASLDVPSEPRLLSLANVQHLATEITGHLSRDIPVLELVGALHPTAAVCGTPSDVAAALIKRLEGMDRGRYTGPVGWVGAYGDGEWGIALRCAELTGASMRLFAGGGIMADSDPDAELAEVHAKLGAMRDAIEGV